MASTLEISEKALNALDQGMRMTGTIGTAEQYLRDYPIPIACKTGTAQWQGTTSTGSFSGSDHASFVLYAPADNPRDRHLRLCRARLTGRQSGECLHSHSRRLFLQLRQI